MFLKTETKDLSTMIPETYIESVFVQLVLALHHCHHPRPNQWVILHRDIKPENGDSHASVRVVY